MLHERRKEPRIPMMKNIGEPVELQLVKDHKRISIPGFILNLSAQGMGIITLGDQAADLKPGFTFMLDLALPGMNNHNVEGKVVRIEQGKKAKEHHSRDEWLIALQFTNMKSNLAKHINKMAEDWSICETKLQMNLPDVCFLQCSYFDICEKNAKLKEKEVKNA